MSQEKAQELTEELSGNSEFLSKREAAAYSYIEAYDLSQNELREYHGILPADVPGLLKKANKKIDSARHIVDTLEEVDID